MIVEFAIVSPLLVTILFGIMEYGYVFLVQQSLTNAAREGCRIAVLQSTTAPYTAVNDRVGEIMDAAGVTSYSVNMTHATAEIPTEQVIVTVPYDSVSLTGLFGSRGFDLTGQCSMRKEGM